MWQCNISWAVIAPHLSMWTAVAGFSVAVQSLFSEKDGCMLSKWKLFELAGLSWSLAIVAFTLLQSGCGSVHATDQTPIWSARDAAEYLAELRASREAQTAQSEDLKAIREDIAETLASVHELHGAVESLKGLVAGGSSLPPEQPVQSGAADSLDGKPVSAAPICFKLDGIDTDISTFIDDWLGERDWTFNVNGKPGTDAELRAHMVQEGVTETEDIAPHILHELHSAWHEYAAANPKPKPAETAKPVAASVAPVATNQSPCPGGVCPNPQVYSPVQTRRVRRGWFR